MNGIYPFIRNLTVIYKNNSIKIIIITTRIWIPCALFTTIPYFPSFFAVFSQFSYIIRRSSRNIKNRLIIPRNENLILNSISV